MTLRCLTPVLTLLILSWLPVTGTAAETLRVGIYQNKPKVYLDEAGNPAGLWVDLLGYIARQEGWDLEYVTGTWQQCLDRLQAGELDIMVDVAYSRDRAELFDFNRETVLSNWARVYSRSGLDIENVEQLQGKRVAVMQGGISFERFKQFNIACEYVLCSGYKEVFQVLDRGAAEAGIISRLYGLAEEDRYEVRRTPIVLAPVELRFAFPKDQGRDLIAAIDRRLSALKQNRDSFYHQTLEQWFDRRVEREVPGVLLFGLAAAVGLGGLFFIFALVLRRQVRAKTRELSERNQALEAEILKRRQAETRLQDYAETLEQKVEGRTRELSEANQRLEEAGRLKSQFLANMSHELRSPLNSIIGFSGILLEGLAGELNQEQRKQLGMVYDSAQHLLGLINDVLDLSKIEAGKIEIQPAEFELRELLKSVQDMVAPLVQKKGLNFGLDVSDIPSTLYNDKNRIKQILINLLSNAVKFTESGRVCLKTDLLKGEAGGEMIRFSVSDTGLGIRTEHLEEVFDEFQQIDGPLKEKPGGTGLGLAICKKMVEMMGGCIGVDSEYGQGSCFWFTIPVQAPATFEKSPAISSEDLDPDKKLILTIDDDKEAQEILKAYLQAEGYEVVQACNGLEAVQLARKFKPFAVTLDIVMPGRDGWDILEELKNDPQTEDIPVICISMLDNRELGLSLGAVDYLVKPIDKDRLTRELERLKKIRSIFDILIVDDDPLAVELLSRSLEELNGYRIRKAYGGQEGLDRVSEQAPDLIILDLAMPEVDGFEVIGRLKKEEPGKHIPIIIVSGKKMTQEEIEWLNSRIEYIIQKEQFNKENLLRDIKKALGGGEEVS
ncbi:MAG: response regulator [Desulfohalobiaceae bacterium]|nr:response regulator [Desulfohalobiaceae bacterium]